MDRVGGCVPKNCSTIPACKSLSADVEVSTISDIGFRAAAAVAS